MDEKAATSPEKCFKTVALGWHKTNKKWSPDYAERILASMNNHIFPAIGHLPVTTLKTQHFTALLRVIEDKGFLEVASRTRQQLCNIMRYAVQQGLTETTRRSIWKASPRRRLKTTIPPCRRRGCPNCLSVLVIISRDGS